MNKHLYKLILVITFLMILVTPLMAQGPPGPPATPIDGGLSLLLAAGIAYGARKVVGKRKSQ